MNCTDNTTYIPGKKKITPTGTIEITENGIFDVAQYASADVNVSGGGGDDSFAKLIDRSIITANIPNGVTSVGEYSFYKCSSLASVDIPIGITEIETYSFYGCSSLASVDIPNTVESIENYAFGLCSGLKSVSMKSGLQSIGQYAFYGCQSIRSVDIPNTVNSIGNFAFSGCRGLQSITVRANTPPTIGNSTFQSVPTSCAIYVPSESVEAYKAADKWSARAAHIQAIQE